MDIERIVPETAEWVAYYSNHICRYQFAAEKIKTLDAKKILDAACGVGYGTCYLSEEISYASVIGVDRSKEALSIAKQKFTNENVTFLEDDCHTLNAAKTYGLYDVIVSFETLEHLPFPEKFLQSCLSNLHDGATLIVSTPNQLVSSPNGLQWKFHEKEYTVNELIKLLEKVGFESIELYGQRLTALGRFREQIRGVLNRHHFNPFIKLGEKIQAVLRKRKFSPILPEQPEDLEIIRYDQKSDIEREGINGPFVLIAMCKK